MKITKEIIERIEGEASLELEWEKEQISFAKIKFLNFRGIENILEGRPFLDALAITPRVCGICSTSHIVASVCALENAYENQGFEINLSEKSKKIRKITLNAEKIQNHIKWFYFSIYPEIMKFEKQSTLAFNDEEWKKAQKIITKILKLAAIFCGQWPHASFCMVGGVTSEPLQNDIENAKIILEEIRLFCEEELFGTTLEEYIGYNSSIQIMANNAFFSKITALLMKHTFNTLGKSHDNFFSLNDTELQKSNGTTVANAEYKFITESLENSFFLQDGYTFSKSALYKGKYYETGPLARMMNGKNLLIRDLHRRYKDSTFTRIIARVSEIAHLILETKALLEAINIKEPSYHNPKVRYIDINSKGIGIVEAARGVLIHEVKIKKGLIESYDIITPTVWNLGNGSRQKPSIAQKAIMGLTDIDKADFVFKSFDICSVCTTQ
jgi:hydrogenase large subunit